MYFLKTWKYTFQETFQFSALRSENCIINLLLLLEDFNLLFHYRYMAFQFGYLLERHMLVYIYVHMKRYMIHSVTLRHASHGNVPFVVNST